MMTMESAAVRVARGVALLDEKRPGWWEQINARALESGLREMSNTLYPPRYISPLEDTGR